MGYNGFLGDSRSHEGPHVILRDVKEILKDLDASIRTSRRPVGHQRVLWVLRGPKGNQRVLRDLKGS